MDFEDLVKFYVCWVPLILHGEILKISIKFESWALSAYYIRTRLIRVNIFRPKLSATLWNMSVCTEW